MENGIVNWSEDQVKARQNTFITNIYGLMSGALAITGFIAWYVISNESIMAQVAPYYGPLILLEIGVVLGLIFLVNKISVNVARLLFVVYAAVNGLTLSVILYHY